MNNEHLMMIDLEAPIAQLIEQYPHLKDILFELGFKDIINPIMLKTVAKFMSLNAGSKFKKIDINLIIKTLNDHGFIIKE